MRTQVLVTRVILGAGFGVAISRFFFPKASLVLAIGLGGGLAVLAYLTEYLRNRSKARLEKSPRVP
jgi:hypothetical protein